MLPVPNYHYQMPCFYSSTLFHQRAIFTISIFSVSPLGKFKIAALFIVHLLCSSLSNALLMNKGNLITCLIVSLLKFSLMIARCVIRFTECVLIISPSTHRIKIKLSCPCRGCINFHSLRATYACDHKLLWSADFMFCAVCRATPLQSSSKVTHPPTFLLSMCDYITLASSPPLRAPSETVPGVGVCVQSRPFSLSMGCYWWGEVIDLPAVLTGTLWINQTVGKTQPAIPPLSRLKFHFISFIYGGSALFRTPPLSNLTLKYCYSNPPFIKCYGNWYTSRSLFTPLFPGNILHPPTLLETSPCLCLVVEVKMWGVFELTGS